MKAIEKRTDVDALGNFLIVSLLLHRQHAQTRLIIAELVRKTKIDRSAVHGSRIERLNDDMPAVLRIVSE